MAENRTTTCGPADKKENVKVSKIIFRGRKGIPWEDVGEYMKRFQGQIYIVSESGDEIHINLTSVDEYVSSGYTRGLKGTLAKVKANIAQILPELIQNASNRRWVENKEEKHRNDASRGWYRYEVSFSMPVKAENDEEVRWNQYCATMVVRANDRGLYLYDIIAIKKEVSNPR